MKILVEELELEELLDLLFQRGDCLKVGCFDGLVFSERELEFREGGMVKFMGL